MQVENRDERQLPQRAGFSARRRLLPQCLREMEDCMCRQRKGVGRAYHGGHIDEELRVLGCTQAESILGQAEQSSTHAKVSGRAAQSRGFGSWPRVARKEWRIGGRLDERLRVESVQALQGSQRHRAKFGGEPSKSMRVPRLLLELLDNGHSQRGHQMAEDGHLFNLHRQGRAEACLARWGCR